jgi:hypothetical protein
MVGPVPYSSSGSSSHMDLAPGCPWPLVVSVITAGWFLLPAGVQGEQSQDEPACLSAAADSAPTALNTGALLGSADSSPVALSTRTSSIAHADSPVVALSSRTNSVGFGHSAGVLLSTRTASVAHGDSAPLNLCQQSSDDIWMIR